MEHFHSVNVLVPDLPEPIKKATDASKICSWIPILDQETSCFGAVFVTDEGFLIQMSAQGKILRAAKVANFVAKSSVELARFRCEDRCYVGVLIKSGSCSILEESGIKFELRISIPDAMSMKKIHQNEWCQLEVMSSNGSKVSFPETSIVNPDPDPDANHFETKACDDAIKAQSDKISRILVEAKQDLKDFQRRLDQMCLEEMSGDCKDVVKDILLGNFGSDPNPFKISKLKLEQTWTAHFVQCDDLLLFYQLTNGSGSSLTVQDWEANLDFITDSKIVGRDLTFITNIVTRKFIDPNAGDLVANIVRKMILDPEMSLDPDKDLKIGSGDQLWLTIRIKDLKIPQNSKEGIRPKLTLKFADQSLDVDLTEVEISNPEILTRSRISTEIPLLLCSLGIYQKKRLRFKSYLKDFPKDSLINDLAKIGFIPKEDLAGDLLINTQESSQLNGMVAVILNDSGKFIEADIYGQDQSIFKNFIIAYYSNVDDDVEVSVGDFNPQPKMNPEESLAAECRWLSRLGSKAVTTTKKKMKLESAMAEKHFQVEVGSFYRDFKSQLNSLEIMTDLAIYGNK